MGGAPKSYTASPSRLVAVPRDTQAVLFTPTIVSSAEISLHVSCLVSVLVVGPARGQ